MEYINEITSINVFIERNKSNEYYQSKLITVRKNTHLYTSKKFGCWKLTADKLIVFENHYKTICIFALFFKDFIYWMISYNKWIVSHLIYVLLKICRLINDERRTKNVNNVSVDFVTDGNGDFKWLWTMIVNIGFSEWSSDGMFGTVFKECYRFGLR